MRRSLVHVAAAIALSACPADSPVGSHSSGVPGPGAALPPVVCDLPPSVNSGFWPNQPPELPIVADQTWGAPLLPVLNLVGWTLLWGTASLASDAVAPFTPPFAAKIDFPTGFIGSKAPGTLVRDMPAARQVYVSVWWKASDPWQGHPSNSNKIEYLFTNEHGSMALIMYGTPGGPYELRVFPDWHGDWLRPNVGRTPVTLGAWHQIEWFVQYGPPPAGARNSIVRWWMDGELLGNYCDVRLSAYPLTQLKLAPVWGGAEEVAKTEDDFFLYGPVRLSGR